MWTGRLHWKEIKWALSRIPKCFIFLGVFFWASEYVQRVIQSSVLWGENGINLAATVLIAWQQKGSRGSHDLVLKAFS